ncbi:MAG TPA: hypothetical protein VGU25_15685 [Acidobacteriaceae bacterium]|nr:hypothetical protein [Acidobacteriaceae bacterium]
MPRWWVVLPVLVIAALAVIFFVNRRPPVFADYVEWTYHGVLLRDWLQGHPDSAYLLKNYPVPNNLTTVGLGLLMLVMPWGTAAKVWLLIEVLLGLWCATKLQRAAGAAQGWQSMVVTAGALVGINLWCGFSNFQFSTYFAMLFCALLMENVESGWLYALLLVLLFFSHMIPFGFALCLLFLYAWQTGRWRLLWQTLPSIVLCVWYFAGRLTHHDVDGTAGMVGSVPYGSLLFAAFRVNTYLKCWGFVNVASTFHDSILLKLVGPTVFVVLFALDVVVGGTVLALAICAARNGLKKESRTRFFWIAVCVFFFVGLIMPGAAAGISDPGGRMLQLAAWCGVCAVVARRKWIGNMTAMCAAVLAGFSLYQVAVVAQTTLMQGTTEGPLPGTLRQFGHVVYTDRAVDYDNIVRGRMDADIYPTAMFLKRPER